MPFSIIVSTDLRGGIGIDNKLPWHIPQDLDWFKKNTINSTVIMGSNTYFSLPSKYRPLPNRKNIVLTKDDTKRTIIEKEGGFVRNSIEEVLVEFKNDNCFIIGGQNIFDQFIDYVDFLYITKVAGDYKCDTFFNYLPKEMDYEWIKYEETPYIEEGFYVFKFLIFKKIVDYKNLEFMYNFYTKTTDDIILIDKSIFENSEEYTKTKELIMFYLRTNKIEKLKNMINETKSSN